MKYFHLAETMTTKQVESQEHYQKDQKQNRDFFDVGAMGYHLRGVDLGLIRKDGRFDRG